MCWHRKLGLAISILGTAFVAIVALGLSITPALAQEPVTITIQLDPDTGKSLGVISRQPETWPTDHSTAILPFGNYIGPQTGEATYARSYLWFPLDSIPAGSTVQEATLEVYVDDWPFDGEADIGVYSVASEWNEDMTWGTLASVITSPLTVTHVSSTPGWYSWDVTGQVQAWLAGEPNYGLMLAAAPEPDIEPDGVNWAGAARGRTSADPSLAPRLVVVLLTPPTPTPTPTHTSTPTPTFTPTPVPPTPTPMPPAPVQPTPTPVPPTPTPTPQLTPPYLPVTGGMGLPILPPLILAGAALLALSRLTRKQK